MATLIVKNPTQEQLEHIWRAEDELKQAGVTFDVSHGVDGGIITDRQWHLDWSVKGAEIRE